MERPLKLNILALTAALAGAACFAFSASPASAFNMKTCLKKQTRLECLCDRAIDVGTKAALKQFIVTYGRTRTSCNAAASTIGIKIPAKPTAAAVAVQAAAKNNNGLGNGDEGTCSGSGCTDDSNPGQGGSSTAGGGGGGSSGGGSSGGGGNGGGKK